MKYVYIGLVCLSILLNGCISLPPFINGKYSGKNPHTLVFFEDSTFKYEYHAMWYSESSGSWRKKGNLIYLTSFEQRDKIPIEYVKTKNNQRKSIVKIKINILEKPETDYICFTYINGKPLLDERSLLEPHVQGSYSFDTKVPVDSLYFLVAKRPFVLRGTGYAMCYDDIRTETIHPHLSIGETLDVTVNIIDSLFGYKVFKDKKIELKNRKIIFRDKGRKNKLYLKQ